MKIQDNSQVAEVENNQSILEQDDKWFPENKMQKRTLL